MTEFAALQTALLQSIAIVAGVLVLIVAVTVSAYWFLFVRSRQSGDVIATEELVVHLCIGPCLTEDEIAEIEAENIKEGENELWKL